MFWAEGVQSLNCPTKVVISHRPDSALLAALVCAPRPAEWLDSSWMFKQVAVHFALAALLFGGAGDAGVAFVDFADRTVDTFQHPPEARVVQGRLRAVVLACIDATAARCRPVRGRSLLDFLGRLLRAVRPAYAPHRPTGKAAARLTRRFDGGVQRQQVGLLGDRADHFQHLADIAHLPLLQVVLVWISRVMASVPSILSLTWRRLCV